MLVILTLTKPHTFNVLNLPKSGQPSSHNSQIYLSHSVHIESNYSIAKNYESLLFFLPPKLFTFCAQFLIVTLDMYHSSMWVG